MSKVDFHIHTTASDGTLSPKNVVKLAKEKNLNLISITDHDTTNGLEEALKEGKSLNINVIPGIELSTTHNNENIHILGYFRDNMYKDNYFQQFLKDLRDYRINRGKKIIGNLKKFFNIDLDFQKILNSSRGTLARPHIAKAIIESNYDYSWEYIFNNILNQDSPAFVPNKKITIKEGLTLLKSYNAIVVLAHPILIKKSNPSDLMRKFEFDGIEAIYPQNSPNDTINFNDIAKSYKKLITAGSDFHGINHSDTLHGKLGCVTLSEKNTNNFVNMLNKKVC